MSRSDVPTAETLLEEIARRGHKPVAFQALWDGDTDGWMVCLELVFESGATYARSGLASLRFGSDVRVFQGVVPPWPEATVATELGEALAKHFSVPFWFPSPTEPDDDCPSWWERDRARACEDCGKPILPRSTPYLPAEICYHCHLRREAKARLRADEPAAPDAVTVLLGREGAEIQIGYASDAGHLRVARFAMEALGRAGEAHATGELVLEGEGVQRFEAELRAEVRELLERFDGRPARETPRFAALSRRVVFEGRELELELRFDPLGQQLDAAISELETARRALRDGLRYWMVFHRGMTERGDRVIRLLRQLNGQASIAAIAERCGGELDAGEVSAALARLAELGYVVVDAGTACLTRKGWHV